MSFVHRRCCGLIPTGIVGACSGCFSLVLSQLVALVFEHRRHGEAFITFSSRTDEDRMQVICGSQRLPAHAASDAERMSRSFGSHTRLGLVRRPLVDLYNSNPSAWPGECSVKIFVSPTKHMSASFLKPG